ncbi:MAG TPA: ATP-binding protein [Oxalicibacterium sp.]|jgi:anti-sigma regulatory factor (Ser/Thr protein kinase)|nr:ATP-binding protein [Oxalicibacterium sp.]
MESILNALPPQSIFHIAETTQVAAVRRSCGDLAARLDFDETQAGRLAIVVTEAATNILKHGSSGDIIIRGLASAEGHAIEILAIDHGQGITNVNASLCDGVSTAGSSGTGLGAMQRLSAEFDIYSAPDKGTAIYMLVLQQEGRMPVSSARIGAICLPLPSEEVSGDAWACRCDDTQISVIVADGLGHGPDARAAALPAIGLLQDGTPPRSPQMLIHAAHRALRATRGAAVAAAELDLERNLLRYAGVGNIAAHLFADERWRQIMSHNGIVGHNMRNVQEFSFDWTVGAMLILHSDGLQTQWDLAAYPGLEHRHPVLIAAILFRDFSRKRDDVTIIVLQRTSS